MLVNKLYGHLFSRLFIQTLAYLGKVEENYYVNDNTITALQKTY